MVFSWLSFMSPMILNFRLYWCQAMQQAHNRIFDCENASGLPGGRVDPHGSKEFSATPGVQTKSNHIGSLGYIYNTIQYNIIE